MTDAESPIRPSTETNVLLGQLMAKVDAVKDDQGTSRAELSALRSEVSELKSGFAVLRAQQAPRASWWQIVSGFAGIGAIIVVIIQLFSTR